MAVKRLEGSSKPFDGTIGEKIHEFITTFEAWFRSYALRDGHELSDIEKIDAVIHGTTAVAKRTLLRVQERENWKTWEDLKKYLKATYGRLSSTLERYEDFKSIQQRSSESVVKYTKTER